MPDVKQKLISIENNKLKVNKKQLKIRITAILIIFLVVYTLGEVIVRIFDPQQLYNEHSPSYPTYPKEVEFDKDLGWSTVKNYQVKPYSKQGKNQFSTITHNSKGYRMDHEVNEEKNIIVMTGDSLTYGFWVDDENIVSAQLNKLLGNEWDIINLGVGGYGTDQSFLRFIRDGLQYKPKVVVHTLFTNDFSNIVSKYQYNVYKPLFVLGDGALQLTNVPVPVSPDIERSYPKDREHAFKGFKRIMRSWSHLYILYKNKISQTKSKIKNMFNPKTPEKQDYFAAYKDSELWSIEREYSDVMNYAFVLNSFILREYNDLAKQNNITFIFVVIGDRISVDPKMQKETEDRYFNIDENFFDYEKPYRLLEDFAEEENIKIINLYPTFKKEFQENKKDIYLVEDHHLNDYGHEVYAKEIYNLLIEEGIV